MRIVGGRFRGTALATVGAGDAAARLRPTADRVRESVFNLLTHGGYGDPVAGARVLDLFAGTGALGLEALSRGALHAAFVENGRTALGLIRRNVELTRTAAETAIIPRDATRLGACPCEPFDLAFLDPPYGRGLGERALASAAGGGWLAPEALVVLEEGAELPAPAGFTRLDHRRYGAAHVHLLQRTGPSPKTVAASY